MAKTAKKRPTRTPAAGRNAPRRTSTIRPISTAGLDAIGANEPGVPDGLDLAETARPMSPQGAMSLDLAGGDLDADFHGLDSGEEAVGGSDPLPDQNDVDRIGHALGVEEQDEQPLATTEKIAGRDDDRWELDPASAEDFTDRERSLDETPPPRRRRQR